MRTQIETHSGRVWDLTDPLPSDIFLRDVSTALANTCRFGGHTTSYYSVAAHAVFVSQLVCERGRPDLALAALHHDTHEAYLGDIPTPLKRLIGTEYEKLRKAHDEAIGLWLGIDPHDLDHPDIKVADEWALRWEAEVLKDSRGCGPHWGYGWPAVRLGWSPVYDRHRARSLFEAEHLRLVKELT
jgi:uncharacterized protein